MKRMVTWTIAAAITVLHPVTAVAGGTAVVESSAASSPVASAAEATRTELAWQSEDVVRIQTSGDGDYIVSRDGKAYLVSHEAGQPSVMDMAAMMKMMRSRGGGATSESMDGDVFGALENVEPTGRAETVAGIRGDVYRVTATDGRGETRTDEWVLSDDPLVKEMTRAYYGSMKPMFGLSEEEDPLARWEAKLPAGQTGVLRAGDQYRIISISSEEPAPSAFELPAPPMDLEGMLKGN